VYGIKGVPSSSTVILQTSVGTVAEAADVRGIQSLRQRLHQHNRAAKAAVTSSHVLAQRKTQTLQLTVAPWHLCKTGGAAMQNAADPLLARHSWMTRRQVHADGAHVHEHAAQCTCLSLTS
jgi:hypothetical protein